MGFITVATAVATIAAAFFIQGHQPVVKNACKNLEDTLQSEVVGQNLTLKQLIDATCHHIADTNPTKPLVIAFHGPPGVGKTLTHYLMAKALYNKDPSHVRSCPGTQCSGYKVVYGLDYTIEERSSQLNQMRKALIDHVKQHTHSLLVIEEYDKLDCEARGALRQFLQHPEMADPLFSRAIILFESNLGLEELDAAIESAGGRDKVSLDSTDSALRNVMFDAWSGARRGALGQPCETREDTLKMTTLIDFVLPYFPLERCHIKELTRRQLTDMRHKLLQEKGMELVWGENVEDFLVDAIEFVGPHAVEGGKPVANKAIGHVAGHLRRAPHFMPNMSYQGALLRLSVPHLAHIVLATVEYVPVADS